MLDSQCPVDSSYLLWPFYSFKKKSQTCCNNNNNDNSIPSSSQSSPQPQSLTNTQQKSTTKGKCPLGFDESNYTGPKPDWLVKLIEQHKQKEETQPIQHPTISTQITQPEPYQSLTSSTLNSEQKNKDVILSILSQYIQPYSKGKLLELASGRGIHASAIAEQYGDWIIQVSDADEGNFENIRYLVQTSMLINIKQPLIIDVTKSIEQWSVKPCFYDAVLMINLIHMLPSDVLDNLFTGCSHTMKHNALLFVYGAFNMNNEFTSESNGKFDAYLKNKNPAFGLRDFDTVVTIATQHGFELIQRHDCSSNNMMIVWKKIRREESEDEIDNENSESEYEEDDDDSTEADREFIEKIVQKELES